MKICRIALSNLNSLRIEYALDFEQAPLSETGLFAITGDTGAGKTTLLDAITLALYGQVPRHQDPKEVLSFGATECYAEVDFVAKGQKYRSKWSIHRARKHIDGKILGPDMELSRWDEDEQEFVFIADKIRQVRSEVERITGLDYTRFTRSVLLSQGEFAAFLESDEKERSELLERITGTEIYSQLSKAAFEKHKLEKAKMEHLQIQRQALNLLSEEELHRSKTDVEEVRSQIEVGRKELSTLRKINQWQEELQERRMTYQEAMLALKQWEETKEAFRREETQLVIHQQALPLKPVLDKLRECTREVEEARQDVSTLEGEYTAVKKKHTRATTAFTETKAALDQAEKNAQNLSEIIAQARVLDSQIHSIEPEVEAHEKKYDSKRASLSKIQQTQKESAAQIQSLKVDLQKRKNWIEQHAAYAQLPEIYTGFTHLSSQWQSLQSEKKATEEKQKELVTRYKAEKKRQEQLLADIKKRRAQIKTLETQFKERIPKALAQSRTEVLQHLRTAIAEGADQHARWQQYNRLRGEYQEHINQLSRLQEQFDNLSVQEQEINKQLLNSDHEITMLRQRYQDRLQVLEQQQRIANYAADRTKLQPGDPCPLCLSEEHPFHSMQIEPFVDLAQEDANKAAKELEQATEAYRKLLLRQQQLSNQLTQLSGQQMNSAIEQELSHIQRLEQHMAEQYVPALEQESTSTWPQQKQDLQALEVLDNELQQIESSLHSQLAEEQKAATTIAFLQQQLDELQEQIKGIDQKTKLQKKELDKMLEVYVTDWEKDLGTIGEKLASWRDYYKEQQQSYEAERQRLQLLEQETTNANQQESDLEKVIEELQLKLETSQQQLQEKQQKRIELLGDKTTDQLLEESSQRLKEQKVQLQSITQLAQKLNVEQHSLQTSIAERQARIVQLTKQQQALIQKANSEASSLQFTDWTAVEDALLSDSLFEKLSKRADTLRIEGVKLKAAEKATQKALQTHKDKKVSDKKPADVLAELSTLEQHLSQLQQQLGRIQEQIDANELQLKRSLKINQKIEKQEQELKRWASLDDLIGQASGKKFRAFAQNLTLRHLTQLANQHLNRLSGRYLIRNSPTQALSLEVEDRYQAANIRSMNSLSGGEQFLISLALALGLSDLAGQQARIESLFIDEGFGTLDERTLDIAITTLENLQASGKTIGIISHVPALKERIAVQVRVDKQGNGTSGIQLISN